MKEFWRFITVWCFCVLNLSFCSSLNDEGVALLKFKERIVSDPNKALSNWIYGGVESPCSWFGVECSQGYVVVLSRYTAHRKLLQVDPPVRRPGWHFLPPPDSRIRNLPPPPPSFSTPAPAPAPALEPLEPPPSPPMTRIVPPLVTPTAQIGRSGRGRNRIVILSASIGGTLLVVLLIVSILLYKSCKVVTITPWATGLSGQLQRAFVTGVTGVPKLKRSELEAACEGFSNVIGYTPVCTLYKGTLSSGVEIAVESIAVASAKEWSKNLESQFRKKIDTISKVSHKNFLSLLGYCVEEEPFTRILVFEYAPNGTLFEHLHIREAEHLDWDTRLRIAMGMAYCLDHMHQLSPPLPHRNLTSSSIYLTEDYAAKVSDFVLSNGPTPERQPSLENNVYDFGVVLFEIITGKMPYSTGTLQDGWASDYLGGVGRLRDVVDPTLRTYREDQIEMIGGVIKLCAQSDTPRRPCMREVCGMLRDITRVGPNEAVPKLSPLWWAEIEIMSDRGS